MINFGPTEILIIGGVLCIGILALLAAAFIRLIRGGSRENMDVDR